MKLVMVNRIAAVTWPLLALIAIASSTELEFLSEPTSRLVKLSDGRAAFRCEVSPASAEVRWLWKGQPVVSNRWIKISKNKLTVHFGKSDKKLPHELEHSYFQCEARHKGRVLVSAPAELIVAVLEPFPPQKDIHITAVKGNTVVIPCRPPNSIPDVLTEFLFNNTIIIDRTSDRRMIMPSGDLQILDTQPEDSGEYFCLASNPYLSEKVEAKHKIILQVKESEKNEPLHFLVSPVSKTQVVLGSNITLECAAKGHPVPSIIWRKEHGHLPRGRHHQVAGNLQLFGVNQGDEGAYYCDAENTRGDRISKSTVIEVHETPQILKAPRNAVVNPGENVVLQCVTRGHPKPTIFWMHNGKMLHLHNDNKAKDPELVLRNVSSWDSGMYQCFVKNELGTVYATSHVVVSSPNSTVGGADKNNDYDEYDSGEVHHPAKSHRWKGGRHSPKKHHPNHNDPSDGSNSGVDGVGKRHRKRKKHRGVKLVPPSRPEVTRLSDTSVMVRWGVPRNDGLPILFFKVQFKEIGKKGTHWQTVEEDIAAHIHSYAVTNLENGGKYRFRIAAVYSNSDNKLGPNSAKFVLYKDPPMKKPVVGPIISHAEAISPSAITLYWEYEDLDSVPIEGFFIYYRTTHSAGDYLKVTVLGANTRSHIISHLLPDTSYDIKTQCFNIAGTSEFSNIYTCKTKPSENVVVKARNSKSHHHEDEASSLSASEPVSSKDSEGNMTLHIVLGVISAALLIAITIFVVIYVRQKSNRQQTPDDEDDEENNEESLHKIGNGHIGNGYMPVNKVNVNVNPLSELNADGSIKSDQQGDPVSNNNEIIRLQTFSSNEAPHLEPLMAGETKESAADAGQEELELGISQSGANNSEVPRSV